MSELTDTSSMPLEPARPDAAAKDVKLPELSLVVLVGASGSGKSTFAKRHFLPTEVISSDFCRGLVCDNENSLEATRDAFELLHFIASKRLAAGKLTLIDATNVQQEARKPLVELARKFHVLPVAIVLNVPERICHDRNRTRADRDMGPHVIRNHVQQLRRSIRGLGREGFRHIFVLGPDEIDRVRVIREPLWNNLRHLAGPFDIIGDVHGCADELEHLLADLGYIRKQSGEDDGTWGRDYFEHPQGRQAIFVGDLGDRGPRILDVLRLVRNMVARGTALCVPGNHDIKLLRKLRGKQVQITHGLDKTLAEIDSLPPESREQFVRQAADFIDDMVSHYVLCDGRLVVAHAGMKEEMQGRGSGAVREFALFGETTGETDEFGLPVRYQWAEEYRGRAMVVYGHTPVPEVEWLNNTVNIDTGCVFGGKLSALRFPEREIVSVPARATYCQASKPFIASELLAPMLNAQQRQDDLLHLEDVCGKRIVHTRLAGNITIREENSSAALEVMSRFAIDPKWLIYLPPTMSPCGTSRADGLLEHPAEAFSYFKDEGVPRVVCEEKHMGSRAVVIVCKDKAVAQRRFGVVEPTSGVCYTRTGRQFFNEPAMESALTERVRHAADASGLWDELSTDWICLDCELMPWSAKAQELIRQQYAAVSAAASLALGEIREVLAEAGSKIPGLAGIAEQTEQRSVGIQKYTRAYQQYCWEVNSIRDLKLAPFHLLASEGAVHFQRDHLWHMQMLSRLCGADGEVLLSTPFKIVDVLDDESIASATKWWEDLTAGGGEGMVIKPLDFVVRGRRGLVQPAVKCRGREYLRIIYGPMYDAPENLERLRMRGLGMKRSLAAREFALGIEGLERFVRREPLRRVHECAFGVLAMESEPVDPRL